MLKKISWIIIVISLFFISNVYALTYNDTFNEHYLWIPNEFINKEKDGNVKYQQMSMMVRKSDNSFVYCIEPGRSLDENTLFTGYDTDQAQRANLTSSQWDRIQLLAFYGYGYKDHLDLKWYVITQYMIWQTNNLGYDIYFTDKLNGNKIIKYLDEMNELENLVNNHYKFPRFDNTTLKLFAGDTKEFIDQNNALGNFVMTYTNTFNINVNGNKLIVESLSNKSGNVVFTKKSNRFYRKSVVYIDSISQNLFLPGDLSELSDMVPINLDYGSVLLQKLDYDTRTTITSGEGSLENALYGLYDKNDILLEQKYTDNTGKILFDSKLSKGYYYIKEIEAPKGYVLSNIKYSFEVSEKYKNQNLKIYEKIIKENFTLNKYIDDGNDILVPEENIEFEIYDKNNTIVKSVVTNSDGIVSFDLPYGMYTVKQKNTTYGYNKIKDLQLNVLVNNKKNNIVLKNVPLKYKLQVVIKDENNEYIKDIELKINEMSDYMKSDDNGVIVFENLFDLGNYQILLNNNVYDKYTVDKKMLDININENSKYYIKNDYKVIEIELLLKNKSHEITKNDEIIEPTNYNTKNDLDEDNNAMIDESFIENKVESQKEDYIIFPNTKDNDYFILLIIISYIVVIIKKIAI